MVGRSVVMFNASAHKREMDEMVIGIDRTAVGPDECCDGAKNEKQRILKKKTDGTGQPTWFD